MHLVQILERLGGNALLIIGFGKVEVSFCQAEERELEPDARSSLIVKFDRRGAPLPGLDGGREIGLLAGIRHLTAPVVGRPARMARVIEGVEAYEHIIGLGARLDVPDILNPLRSIPRSGFVHTGQFVNSDPSAL